MEIMLTIKQIDDTLPKVKEGLHQYVWLQSKVKSSIRFYKDPFFQKKYNHFYRVRRASAWQKAYYGLMARARKQNLTFHAILELLRQATNRVEASFASKLLATLAPKSPVIDSKVLKNLGARLPATRDPNRISRICTIHDQLVTTYTKFLASENGKYLVSQFKATYPQTNITEIKMLDFILWKC